MDDLSFYPPGCDGPPEGNLDDDHCNTCGADLTEEHKTYWCSPECEARAY